MSREKNDDLIAEVGGERKQTLFDTVGKRLQEVCNTYNHLNFETIIEHTVTRPE